MTCLKQHMLGSSRIQQCDRQWPLDVSSGTQRLSTPLDVFTREQVTYKILLSFLVNIYIYTPKDGIYFVYKMNTNRKETKKTMGINILMLFIF